MLEVFLSTLPLSFYPAMTIAIFGPLPYCVSG